MTLSWDMDYARTCMPLLVTASKVTLSATAVGMSIALLLGLAFALARQSPFKWLAWPMAAFIEFIRSTPLLIQVYFLFYVLPTWGIQFQPFLTGALALGLHYSAYTSEVYRAGIQGVPQGQWEAARALNIGTCRTFCSIILPQAIRPIIPPLGNYLVAMFKDTPVLSTITVLELLNTAKQLGSEHFRYLEPITLVGGLFLVISLLAVAVIRRIEITIGRSR